MALHGAAKLPQPGCSGTIQVQAPLPSRKHAMEVASGFYGVPWWSIRNPLSRTGCSANKRFSIWRQSGTRQREKRELLITLIRVPSKTKLELEQLGGKREDTEGHRPLSSSYCRQKNTVVRYYT